MISSYVGENAEFERQYLSGELELELTPQVGDLKIVHKICFIWHIYVLEACWLDESVYTWDFLQDMIITYY